MTGRGKKGTGTGRWRVETVEGGDGSHPSGSGVESRYLVQKGK